MTARSTANVEFILGFGVTTSTMAECVAVFLSWLDGPRVPRWIACLNPHSCMVAARDADFTTALQSADLLIPDGIGIVLASRLQRGGIRQRVTGPDFFLAAMAALNARGAVRVYFLGASATVLGKIGERVRREFPRITICGSYAPPFRDEFLGRDAQEMIEAVNAARPDVLWVGLTAPKQEKWISRHRRSLNVRAAVAMGAAFDFYSGHVNRASRPLRALGLEWMFRLIHEPKRMWRRNFISSPRFLWRVIATALRAGK